jgi:hypothetical protein
MQVKNGARVGYAPHCKTKVGFLYPPLLKNTLVYEEKTDFLKV